MAEVEYPLEIIPTCRHKYPLTAEMLADIKGVFIHRRSDILAEMCFLDGGRDKFHFRPQKLKNLFQHPYNLSVNLLGGDFDPVCHGKWRQVGKGQEYWTSREDVDINNFEGCYMQIPGEYPHFYFRMKDVHEHDIEFPRDFNKESEAQVYELVRVIERAKVGVKEKNEGKPKKNGPIKGLIKGRLFLKHRPSYLNYWHWQVEAAIPKKCKNPGAEGSGLTFEPVPEKKMGSAWGTALLNAQIEYLWEIVEFGPIDYGRIDKNVYLE